MVNLQRHRKQQGYRAAGYGGVNRVSVGGRGRQGMEAWLQAGLFLQAANCHVWTCAEPDRVKLPADTLLLPAALGLGDAHPQGAPALLAYHPHTPAICMPDCSQTLSVPALFSRNKKHISMVACPAPRPLTQRRCCLQSTSPGELGDWGPHRSLRCSSTHP